MALRPITKCAGLYTNPNDIGEIPEGALVEADNVVVSRDGIVEQRRGSEIKSVKQLLALYGFKGRLLGHTGSALSLAASDYASWSDYAGTFTAPAGRRMRAEKANGNLYLASAQGLQRLESPTGPFMPAGTPPGLDLQTSLAGAGNAIPNNTQVAYRSIFGYRDSNGNLILGAPSSRSVIVNIAGSAQNVSVAASLPRNLTSAHFWQLYRTWSSVDQNTDPGDEPGLVYEGVVPTQQAVTQLARATNVVTATTAAAHGYTTGMIVRVSPGGTLPGHVLAIGASTAAERSTNDGATWSAAGISGLPVGTFYGAASSGSADLIVGTAGATSPDGLTYTARTLPAGTWRAAAYANGRFVIVGDGGVFAYSTDGGATWTSGVIYAYTNCTAILWDGARFVCASNDFGVGGSGARIWTSSDGSSWTQVGTISYTQGPTLLGVVYTGSYYFAVGASSGNAAYWYSTDRATWTRAYPGAFDAGQISAACFTGSKVVAVGNTGTVYNWNADGSSLARVALAGAWNAVAWDSINAIAVGVNVAATAGATGSTWTSRTIPAGTYYVALSGGGVTFPAGEKTITGTPTGTSFTYAETGSDGTLVQAQTATPLTAVFTDNVPNTFIGTALYTNPTQLGISGANSLPPLCQDLALFRGCLFFAQVTPFPSLNIALLSVGSPSGVQNGDSVTIDGVVWTGAASESPSGRTFQVYTSGTAAQNIANTAQSLVRVVNRTQASDVYASYVSGPTDPPGQITLTAISALTTISVSFSGHTSSWSPAAGNTVAPSAALNRLAYSPTQQPDSVPLLNYMLVGASDQPILAVRTLRDSLVILKTDGIWRVTGYSPADFRVDPLDVTVNLLAPDTAVALENTVVALTQQGVVRVSDTGVTVISRPVENQILPLLGPNMIGVTSSLAFGVAYESGRKYLLWLPTLSTDTIATHAFVYDLFTKTWTHDTRDLAHAIVNPADDRLYLSDGTNLRQERKSFDLTDFADESYAVTVSSSSGYSVTLSSATNVLVGDRLVQGALAPGAGALVTAKVGNVLTVDRLLSWSAGAATSYRALSVNVEWECQTPRESGPGTLAHWREAAFLFRSLFFAQASAGFATELMPTQANEALTGSNYQISDPPNTNQPASLVRVIVPEQHQRSARLSVSWAMAQAMCQLQLQGMQPVYEPGRERTGR